MKTKAITIVARATNEKVSAELLVCPDCDAETFVIYTPNGMDHVHFQCIACGVSFCDGCADGMLIVTEASPPDDVSPPPGDDGR